MRKTFTDSKGEEYQDYEFKREGVADIYMIVEALGGRREVLVKEDHTSQTSVRVVAHIVENMCPDAKKITLVEDNLSAHKLATLYEIYEPERARSIAEKIEIVRRPKHGSCRAARRLNIAECEPSGIKKNQPLPLERPGSP